MDDSFVTDLFSSPPATPTSPHSAADLNMLRLLSDIPRGDAPLPKFLEKKKVRKQPPRKKSVSQKKIEEPPKVKKVAPPKQEVSLAQQFLSEFLKRDKPLDQPEEGMEAVKVEKKEKQEPIKLQKKMVEAEKPKDGRTPEISVVDEALVWRYQGDEEWIPLIELADLQSKHSNPLADIPGGGGGGRRIVSEFKEEDNIIYHKSSDEDDEAWQPLFELPDEAVYFLPEFKTEGNSIYWRTSEEQDWVLLIEIPRPDPVGFVFDGGFPDTNYETAAPAFSCGGVI